MFCWSVTAKKQDRSEELIGENFFAGVFNPKSHPANLGINYDFKDGISEEVLKNYLNRSMSVSLMHHEHIENFEENLRMILYTGAKYINRAYVPFMLSDESVMVDKMLKKKRKKLIDIAHMYDPEIIFESCVVETASIAYDNVPIPEFVFEDFGLPPEKRCFDYHKMVYDDGHYAAKYNKLAGHPDLSQLETQMWFYHRICMFIDEGFEAIFLGSFPCMTDMDKHDYHKGIFRICDLAHAYAKKHARRGFVLLSAHCHGIVNEKGRSALDFNLWPTAICSKDGDVPHIPTKDNPQEMFIKKHPVASIDKGKGTIWGPIYGYSPKCTVPSGWKTESLPYLVGLDNYKGYPDRMDQPCRDVWDSSKWGLDEIGWFNRQPNWYRRSWLKYIRDEIKKIDTVGHFEMPGLRRACMPDLSPGWYVANLYEWGYLKECNGDEVAIREIWINENKNSGKTAKNKQ